MMYCMTLYVCTYNYDYSSGMVYTVPMCPMVHSDGTDSGDGVYGVGQSPCTFKRDWDMGEGLDSPHVSHGTFRRGRQWGWGIWSGTCIWGKV